jgi:hypothetical protein
MDAYIASPEGEDTCAQEFRTKKGGRTMTNEKKTMTDQPHTVEHVATVEVTTTYLDALRKAVGLHIDPETAEVVWWYEYTLDPYGDCSDLPEECRQVGREYFARSPGSDVWIWFGDLPEATASNLWEKHKSKLAFPAGLFGEDLKNDLAIFDGRSATE